MAARKPIVTASGVTQELAATDTLGTVLALDVNPSASAPAHAEGRVFYDSGEKTLAYYNENSAVTINLGQELVVRVRNTTGAQIDNGKAVYVSGSSGTHPLVTLADNDSPLAERTIGLATCDIGHNNYGYVTVNGMVNGINTNAFSAGDMLWLGEDGALTATQPSSPEYQICVGVCVTKNESIGRIYVNVHAHDEMNLGAQRTAQKEPSGFESPDDVAIAYDSTERTITLTQAGGIVVWVNGVRYVKASPWVSSAHGSENGRYWLTVDSSGSLQWNESVWTFDQVQVAYAYYDADSAYTYALREVHGLMPWQAHRELHETIGTYRRSGLTLTAGTYATSPASPANADNTPGVDLGVLADEDLAIDLSALTQGTYHHLHFTGDYTITFTAGQSLPFRVGTTYVKYWTPGAGAESEAVTNRWLNVYLIAVPASADAGSQAYRFLWMQPQAAYTSLASAQAESFDRLDSTILSGLLFAIPEFFPVTQITYRTSSSYTGATGRCRIEGVQYLTGSRARTVIAGAAQPLVQVAAEGTLVGTEPQINMIAGSGIALTVTDTPASSRVDVTAALNLNGLTADTDPDDTDTAPIYSADASANRKVTLANLKTYFQAGGAGGAVTFNEPAADNAAGTQAIFDSGTVGETVAFPNLLYLKSDGKWWLADADAAASMPGLRMALESKNADESCSMLVTGRVRDDDWNWTIGGVVYASTTAGGYTQTAPSGAADIVQQVGIAYHADKMIFMPSMTTIEIV